MYGFGEFGVFFFPHRFILQCDYMCGRLFPSVIGGVAMILVQLNFFILTYCDLNHYNYCNVLQRNLLSFPNLQPLCEN